MLLRTQACGPLPVHVLTAHPDGRLNYVNPALTQWPGTNPEIDEVKRAQETAGATSTRACGSA